ncbi:MAG TPA: DUF3489 domain-containing protein [Falsiroseomonas sp.]|jgi:hypothetical protein|nr:DUF3489 domain-containing protein [Falsiroseomonas sp.]
MTTATTKTLSAAQLLILTAAAQRPDRMALPLPPGLRACGAARRALLASLLEAGLLEERPTEDGALSWRQDGQGDHHALGITAAGLARIGGCIGAGGSDRPESARGANVADAPGPARGHAGTPGAEGATVWAAERTARTDVDARATSDGAGTVEAAPAAAAHPRGKLGRVLDAVAAKDGATLAELAALTGWQPHTTRAALTGLRRRGFVLVLGGAEDAGGRKAYRLRQEVPA